MNQQEIEYRRQVFIEMEQRKLTSGWPRFTQFEINRNINDWKIMAPDLLCRWFNKFFVITGN